MPIKTYDYFTPQGSWPLDSRSVFRTLEEAEAYIEAENSTAYQGQIISVGNEVYVVTAGEVKITKASQNMVVFFGDVEELDLDDYSLDTLFYLSDEPCAYGIVYNESQNQRELKPTNIVYTDTANLEDLGFYECPDTPGYYVCCTEYLADVVLYTVKKVVPLYLQQLPTLNRILELLDMR
jgi:hypothetical protein